MQVAGKGSWPWSPSAPWTKSVAFCRPPFFPVEQHACHFESAGQRHDARCAGMCMEMSNLRTCASERHAMAVRSGFFSLTLAYPLAGDCSTDPLSTPSVQMTSGAHLPWIDNPVLNLGRACHPSLRILTRICCLCDASTQLFYIMRCTEPSVLARIMGTTLLLLLWRLQREVMTMVFSAQ